MNWKADLTGWTSATQTAGVLAAVKAYLVSTKQIPSADTSLSAEDMTLINAVTAAVAALQQAIDPNDDATSFISLLGVADTNGDVNLSISLTVRQPA
jgi:hypothetical protein